MTGAVVPFCGIAPKTLPIQVVLLTFAPSLPIQITLLADMILAPAWPKTILKLPVVLFESALLPIAVLAIPVVLLASASAPTAVLATAVVLLNKAFEPIAMLPLTGVLWTSASVPNGRYSVPSEHS